MKTLETGSPRERTLRNRLIAWGLTHLMPEALLYPLWRRWTRRLQRPQLPTASDHRTIAVQENVRLEVYWVSDDLGPGPGASFFVFDDEVMRLDCFGGKTGHYHFNPRQVELNAPGPQRLYFPEGSVEDHIERAAFELWRNHPAGQAMNRNRDVRELEIDSRQMRRAASELRNHMRDLLARHGERMQAAE